MEGYQVNIYANGVKHEHVITEDEDFIILEEIFKKIVRDAKNYLKEEPEKL